MKFIVAFGPAHIPYGNGYTVVEADSEPAARKMVFDAIGSLFYHLVPFNDHNIGEMIKYASPYFEWETVSTNPPTRKLEEVW